jgi:multicomponent Na+:H+ antiporter subunit D
LVWLILEIASAGVFLHAGIKFPYFVFFAKDNGLRPGEAPKHMLAAMAFLSFICIFLGIYPQPLYDILPYPVDFNAYTFEHTLNQLQLLMFSALAFFLLLPLLKRLKPSPWTRTGSTARAAVLSCWSSIGCSTASTVGPSVFWAGS